MALMHTRQAPDGSGDIGRDGAPDSRNEPFYTPASEAEAVGISLAETMR